MQTIANVTNSNRLVEVKVNYFIERMIHNTTYIGWHAHLELESPISLIEKIIFRLNDDAGRLEYIDKYFTHTYFTEDTFWHKYPTFKAVKSVISKYNTFNKSQENQKKALIDSVLFHKNLELLHRDLFHNMPEDIMTEVISLIKCRHHLDEIVPDSQETHSSLLSSFALILVSEYYYRGFTKNEILEMMGNVFSKDYIKFPYPVNLKTQREIKKFHKTASLDNQLYGFSNAIKKPKYKGIIMTKLYGGSFPDNFEFKYNNVSFWGINHPKINRIKDSIKDSMASSFFKEGAYILVTTEIEWRSNESLLKNFQTKVGNEIAFLSSMFKRDFNIDTTPNFIRLDNRMQFKGGAWSNVKFENPFVINAIDLQNDNAYYTLRKKNGQAASWFLQFEHIFINAYKSGSISDYWLYLETLLSYNRKNKAIKELTSSIILLNEKKVLNQRISITLANAFSRFSPGIKLIGGSPEKETIILKNLNKGKVTNEIRTLEYHFIKELIKEYDEELASKYYQKAYDYYYKIITEAYESRNAEVHRGSQNSAAKIKLSIIFSRIVFRLRWLILEALKKDNIDTPFDLLINKLKIEGKKLF